MDFFPLMPVNADRTKKARLPGEAGFMVRRRIN
jgi:hypothetical protein